MSEIKTNFELPRGDDDKKYLQRIAQDLSKNFKYISSQLGTGATSSYVSGIDGVAFAGSFSITAPPTSGTLFQIFSFSHSFGSLPSGFLVADLTSSNSAFLTSPIVTRDSWTTTQITIRIAISTLDFASARSQTGTFKIIVLR